MKNYHLTFALAICVLLMTIIMGCQNYQEGDDLAHQRFQKFTSQEKTLYKAVQDVWGQNRLVYVREAVGKRETRPAENMIPFIDIANVIKSNNSAALKLDDTWGTSTKNRYIKARWDRVDQKWFRELMLSMGETDVVIQELIEEVIEDEPERELEPHTYGDVPAYGDDNDDIVKINIKDIIPESKYDDLYYEIRRCDEAVQVYKQIIDDRILTWEDYELLIRISIKCKAAKTLTKMENN